MRKIKISSGAYIAPSFLGVLAFFILPFLVVIYYSLVDNPISGNFVFLDNFTSIMGNTAFRTLRKYPGFLKRRVRPGCFLIRRKEVLSIMWKGCRLTWVGL